MIFLFPSEGQLMNVTHARNDTIERQEVTKTLVKYRKIRKKSGNLK